MPRTTARVIEGRHHPLIRELRATIRSGELLAGDSILLETTRLIEDALASGAAIRSVLISSGAATAARALLRQFPPRAEIYEVSSQVFSSLGNMESTPGIIALARLPEWHEDELFPVRSAMVVVVAGVQDPGNLGTIIRSAEAFGATGTLMMQGTVSPYNAKVVRAAAGSLLRMPMLRDLSVNEIIAILKRHKTRLLCSVVGSATPLPEVEFTGPLAIAVGSEGAGVPKELAEAGERFTIPMARPVESLNVGVATAIVLYAVTQQRMRGKNHEPVSKS